MNTGRDSTEKTSLVSKSLIATAFIGHIQCHVLSNVSHPQFLIFSEKKSVSVYLELRFLIYDQISDQTSDLWVCSCVFPTLRELLQHILEILRMFISF